MPITQEQIKQFMEGTDPMERIVNITYTYGDDFVRVYYKDEEGKKFVRQEKFYPFVWATRHACKKLCGGNKNELVRLMNKYGVRVKQLRNTSVNGEVRHEFDDGYVFMFYATRPMAQKDFTRFFRDAKNPIYAKRDNLGREIYDEPEDERQYLSVSAVEQFMIATGKRFFKGYDDYDQLLRLIFDLETEGLNPETDRITHIGVRSNKGFEKIIYVEGKTKEELDIDEFYAILEFFQIIAALQPDIITAHNGENFDWNFILTRFNKVNTVDDRTYTIEEVCEKIFGKDKGIIFKDERESILKLGGEIETFHATHVPETIITDSLHAVRRAQALDSNMQRADLKYSTKYFEMNKPNRVYIPGNKINTTGEDTTNQYALNDTNGKWYIIDEKHPLKKGYDVVSGREIVRRYLLDDLWECDKVEWKCNTTNFLICKLLPIPYSKCVTMGTAGQWKGLMMAWSYRNNLAIPKAVNTGKFTGGLSRLLKTGYIPNAIKLDFNSLYPSIILTWGISDTTDLMGTMLSFLEYILTTRETFKGLKKNADNKIKEIEPKVIEKNATEDEERVYQKLKAEFAVADGKQNQMKVLGNSFFGSYGSNNGSVFPWKSIKCAEQTTCTGRQSLRLMISHFKKLGYEPIVGDSFTADTPLFVKNEDGWIDIKPVSELIEETETDILGREYDTSPKPYYVLCRSGWVKPSYIYRHKTNKPIYRVEEKDMVLDVTEDHSLFNSQKEKIKPSEIIENTQLEYYNKPLFTNLYHNTNIEEIKQQAQTTVSGDKIPTAILNGDAETRSLFIRELNERLTKEVNIQNYSKTFVAGYNFIK